MAEPEAESAAKAGAGPARLVVMMGPAGSGKSTVGTRLAAALGVDFLEGDDAHSAAAKARMARGEALDDAMRRPWLDRLHAQLEEHAAAGTGAVLACSALTPAYRQRLRAGLDGVVFLALVAPEAVLATRLATRPAHFAGPDLLDSQLDTLELGEDAVAIDATGSIDAVVAASLAALRGR